MRRPHLPLRRLVGHPYLLLAVTVVGWGGNAIVARLAVGEISPMAMVTLRWLVVVAVLAATLRGDVGRSVPALRTHWRFLLAAGALGFTLFNALFYWSGHHTSAVNLSLIQGVTPAFVMIGGLVLFRMPVGLVQAGGVALTLVGIAVAASRGDLEVVRHLAFNVGDLGILAASVLYAGYTLALRDRPRLPPLVLFAGFAFFALLTSLPLLAWEAAEGTLLWPTPFGWALVLFVGLGPSLLCQLLYMRAVEVLGPSRAGLFMNLVPLVAAILAVGLLGEAFATYHAVGLALVLGGIWIAELGGRAST